MLRENVDIEGWDIRQRVDRLLQVLLPYEWDALTKRAVWAWHESEGRFSQAEDLLYELQEEGGVSYAEGEAFYERLAAQEDTALELGGVPRLEMEEGRRQWAALMKEKVQ